MKQKSIGVVGAGIVGLATAYKLQIKFPDLKVIVFEKEPMVGLHQSGRNSGVLHCGLYYEPGSLKARLAVDGIRQMTAFCRENEIDHDICGKIVVASTTREVKFLDKLAERGNKNGLRGLRFLNDPELKSREPHVSSVKTLLVPEEGIVSYTEVMKTLSNLILSHDGEIWCGVKVSKIEENSEQILVQDGDSEWILDNIVNCTGLHTDRTYKSLTGKSNSPIKIVPFRGEYFKLRPQAEKLFNHLIYPVPDPEYPFLGVHFTRMVSGIKEVGPNAVFALKREGYNNTDISISDTAESLAYIGFLNFLKNNFRFAIGEFQSSLFKSVFLKKAQKLIPELSEDDIEKGMSGVRAQAVDRGGRLIMDFRIEKVGRQVHVLNAPSPGATASLAIADYIIENYITNI